jgi:tripartite-type tricarboxylate transporter receptor subunit TctC
MTHVRLVGAALLAWAAAASAQDWPTRPLRWVIGLPAGAGADTVARTVATPLAARLKQPVIVENRPGASENIAMEHVVRSAPDGYTFLFIAASLVTNPHLYKLSFDPMKELVPVAQMAVTHLVLVAHPSLSATTVPQLLALAKEKPAAVTCAHSAGSVHIGCAWFKAQGAVDFTLVPYKGMPQALGDVVGGRADFIFAPVATAVPQVRANRLRVLATTNPRRGQGPFGDAPIVAETLPGFEIETWFGLLAPAGTPPALVAALSRELGEVLRDKDVSDRLAGGGVNVAHAPPEEFAAIVRRDYAKYERVIRETGIKVE